MNPEALSKCLVNWLDVELPDRCVIAVDGKTICGSGNREHKAYHVVGAFVAESQITLGEITVEEKSNEITAVPELLDLLYIDDAIITADSMSYQKKIVQRITDGNADYCIALKENQRNLFKDTEDFLFMSSILARFSWGSNNSPLNMNILRKMALSLLNQAKYGRLSKKRMRFKASLNPEVLLSGLLGGEK